LARIDRIARKHGVTRGACISALASKELKEQREPGAGPTVHRAVEQLEELFEKNDSRGDATALIREQRDAGR
jgi:hypothetical protein